CKGADPEVGMLEGLISLVDKNLLGQEEQADGEPRFRMSETMREYAVDRLAAEDGDEAEKTHLRHAQYFLDLARRAEPMLWGREQIVWLTRLDREFCNFRAAMAWSVGKNGDPQIGLGIGGTLWHFWDLRSILGEGRRWMSALLSATPVQTPERVKALNVMSYLAYLQGDAAAMLPPLQEALTVGRKLDDAFGLALTLTGIGSFAHLGGDSDRAVPLLEEAIDVGRRAEWKFILQSAIGWLAVVAWSRGERARAMALMEQSLGQARECEDAWGGGHSLFFLGKWALQQGKYRRARALLQESLNLRRKLEDRIGVATCMDELACMAAGQGDWERAVRLLGAAEALRESIGADVLAGWQSDSSHAAGKARAALGEQRFENAWEAGKVMTPDAAIELALGEGEPLHPIELPASASRGWSPLTRREREVAVLVAQGRTNQQISAELVISRRTVDAHIANILEKLGFTSRARVAAWAVGIGLISSESPA
ncbi:MAG: LuxR C-terminal-related transcriptional regulator, partial [Chloroflexi bacterium]|nr:LuxR C-terminal-related transcriptional regulator [Chloroflexota bacterium]